MLDLADPFQTLLTENRDFNESDSRKEVEALFARQQFIDDLLKGRISPDQLLQLLSDQGIEPARYLDEVESNINFVIANELSIDPESIRLFLPGLL